ncbi:MAG: hypothetical protein F7B60_01150 [Desulfurococcales archaeon]|nr:hypothetical protein [Desulfurococcales archaeon]
MQEAENVEVQEKDMLNKITELRQKLKEIIEHRSILIDEIKIERRKRRELLDRRRELIEELKKLREEKNKLFEELNKQKEKRNELSKMLHDKIDELKKFKEQFKDDSIMRVSISSIQRRIQQLEWKQQTQVLSSQEENEIVRRIMELEELLEKAREAKKLKTQFISIKAELAKIRVELKDTTAKLREIRENIGKVKERISGLSSDVNDLNKQIDIMTEDIEEKSKNIEGLSKERTQLKSQLKILNEQLRAVRMGEDAKKVEEFVEERRKQVMDKMKKGERLTLEEMKILYGEL